MKMNNNVRLILNLVQEVKEEMNHQEVKALLSGYLEGLGWFANHRGGEVLDQEINALIDRAADQNNIYCFDYQINQMINDRFDYWRNDLKGKVTSREEIRDRIDHLHFIHELQDREETIEKIYNNINN